MGLAGAVINGAVGLFGAASQSADYARAAKQQREEAIYNEKVAIFNAETNAQTTQYEGESAAQNYRRQAEVTRANSVSKQGAMAYEGVQNAGRSTAALAASGAYSPTADLGILEEEKKNFLARQQEQAASDYSQSIFQYQAGATEDSATKTAYNQRQAGLFQGAAIVGQGFAKAAQYDQASSQALTSGIFGAVTSGVSIAASSGLLGGGASSAPSSAPSFAPIPLGTFGAPIQAPSSFGGDFGPISGGNAQSNGAFSPNLYGRS